MSDMDRRYDDRRRDEHRRGHESHRERSRYRSRSRSPRRIGEPSSSTNPSRRDDPERYGDDRYERRRGYASSSKRPERESPAPRRRDDAAPRNKDGYPTRRSPPLSRHQQRPSPSPPPAGPEEEEAEDTPDFTASGLLAKESNQVNGTALKYHEPPEAKQPKKKWRLYVFKDGEEVDLFHISRQSCYLFGRDRNVVDVPLDHTSCSKQHAVIQYRLNITRNEYGEEKRNVKPYLLDLESANGTMVNKRKVPPSRYYELRNGDTVRFAASEREYVLLCEDV